MAWFSKKQPTALVEAQGETTPVVKRKIVSGPRLAVLTPDIAGISSFRITLQDDAVDAESMIAGLRSDVRRGTHAFWAMHEKPDVDESMHVEALVLIRAKGESDVVYVVSFLDLESAQSFTRFEVRRGLYIGNVMVYWAAFAQVREELEGVTILPSVAPPSVATSSVSTYLAPEPRLAPPLPARQASVTLPVAEPEPELETIAEAEARLAAERYLEQNPDKLAEQIAEEPAVIEDSVAVIEPPAIEPALAPVIEPLPIFDDEPVSEEAAIADALVLQHPPVADPIVEIAHEPVAKAPEAITQRRPAPWAPKRRWSDREARDSDLAEQQPEFIDEDSPIHGQLPGSESLAEIPQIIAEEPEPVAEAPTLEALEAEAFESLTAIATKPTMLARGVTAEEIEAQEHDALEVIAERVASFAGDEEAESEDDVEIEARSLLVDPAAGMPQAEKYSEFDIALEVERLLKNRKWESRDGPFRGFKSPPGRF